MNTKCLSSDRPASRPQLRPKLKSPSWPAETVLGMLSESERDGLLSCGALREFPIGSRLFTEGAPSKHVIALYSGWVKVVVEAAEGGQALLALRSRGDLVGEQAAIEDEPRSATVISASPVIACIILQEPFLHYLAEYPGAHLAVTRALSAKLRSATRRRIDFSGPPAHVRLARVLCELARMNSRPTGAGTEIGYALTQPEIAAMVGVSEPSIQRALRRLRDSGVLDTGYRRIIICDLTKLKIIAGLDWNSAQKSIR